MYGSAGSFTKVAYANHPSRPFSETLAIAGFRNLGLSVTAILSLASEEGFMLAHRKSCIHGSNLQ